MNELSVPQTRYTLLTEQSPSKRCLISSNCFSLIMVLATVTFTIPIVYIAYAGLRETIVIPKRSQLTEVPEQWLHRAKLYNSKVTFNAKHIKNKPIKNISNDYKISCYYMFPDENDESALQPQNINPYLCTHINLSFGTVVNDTIYLTEYQLNVSKAVVQLKRINKNLKVILSVGGAGNGEGFPQMVMKHANRKNFIRSILNYVKSYKFDGVDLDWEFPNERSNNDKHQRMHFTQLLQEIREEINRQRNYRFILSVAVAAPVFVVDNSYDVAYMNDYVDYINLMSYDYHFYTKLTPFTGINAPLYSPQTDIGLFATQNINFSANYWHLNGMDKKKIVVGLPTYGHSFSLLNVRNNGIYAPANGYGTLGGLGFVNYDEVCRFLLLNRAIPVFNTDTKSPYVSKSTEWISFDNEKSLTYKAEYIKKNGFGGAMVLSLNADDHFGICNVTNRNNITFPLTKTIARILKT